MITADLKQLSKDYEMGDIDKRFYYKRFNGFLISAYAEEKKRVLIINAYFTPEEYEENKSSIDKIITETDKDNRLIDYSYNNGEFVFEFKPKTDSYFHMSNMIKAITPELKKLNALGADYCHLCHKPLIKGDRQLIELDSSVKSVHHDCEDELKVLYKDASPLRNQIHPSVAHGITISVISAIIASFMWAVLSSVDFIPYISSAAGLAIGYTVKKMYDYGGGKEGIAKILTVPCANALSIFLGSILAFFPDYLSLVRKGEAVKVGFSKLCSMAVSNLANNKTTMLIGFALSIIICFDIFVKKGKIEAEIQAKEYIRHIRSY